MAQTISELEKERAELLKAIEDQAQSMSSGRAGGVDTSSEHTLKDWLNAAEEVMPNRPRNRNNPESQPTSKPETVKSNRASFFGVIIMLSLLLTILGVVYIAYTSIHNELKSVMAIKESSSQEIQQLKEAFAKLEKATAASGNGQLFTQLQGRVATIETEIKQLKESMAATPVQSADGSQVILPKGLVTTAILDAKLKAYLKEINAKLDAIQKHLKMPKAKQAKAVSPEKNMHSESKVTVVDPSIDTPDEPKVSEPKTADKPIVRLVKKVPAPEAPEPASKPLKHYSESVKWLTKQPAFNYTLQLASMTERASVKKMIDSKGLTGTKIIPQERSGETNYVLITGSYASRQEADNAALTYKSEFNISPWVRKIKDLRGQLK